MVDPRKIETVENWLRPNFMMKIGSFVVLPSYYRRFVKKISSIDINLSNLTKKEILFEWTQNLRKASKSSRLIWLPHLF